MGRAMRGDDEDQETQTVEGERFLNASVTVPADGLADFYRAVADWWERYDKQVRGRAMRGRDEGEGG